MIVTILEDLEQAGPGPFRDLTSGSQIDEGNYAGYVLRQQGAKVVPLFLALRDGKLVVKKKATDDADVGSWKISPRTVAEVVGLYAGPAFKADRELVLTSSEAVRSNWMVALGSAIHKAAGVKGAGSQRHAEINFGVMQKTERELEQEAKEAQRKARDEEQKKRGKEDKSRQGSTKLQDRLSEVQDDMDEANLEEEEDDSSSQRQTSSFSLNGHKKAKSLGEGELLDDTSNNAMGTMMFRQEAEDDDNDFYKTFAGSVRIAGKLPADFFSTFQVNDGLDDQDKFANMKLEFEEVNEDDEDDENLHEDGAALTFKTDKTDSLPSSPSSFLFSSPSGAIPPLPITKPPPLVPNRLRSGSTPKKPNMMRIKLKTKSPEGPIKIYRGCLESKDEFKCLMITSDTKTEETLRVALEQFEANALRQYVLVEEEIAVGEQPATAEGQPERLRRMLDPQESPLIAKLNWDTRNVRFAIYSRDEFVSDATSDSGNTFRVQCLDGTTYAMKYHAKLSVSRVCEILAEKFQLQKVSYALFSLWMVGDKLELQLEPFKQLGNMVDEWPKHEKAFTEQQQQPQQQQQQQQHDAPGGGSSGGGGGGGGAGGGGNGYKLYYRRWAFLSRTAERRIKDPQAISLLFEQASKMVMEEIYPSPQEHEDLITLAGIKCQLMFGDYKEEVHGTGNFVNTQSEGLKLLFPEYFFGAYFKKDDAEKKVIRAWKLNANKTKMIVQLLYLQLVRQVRILVFFFAQEAALLRPDFWFFPTSGPRTAAPSSRLL